MGATAMLQFVAGLVGVEELDPSSAHRQMMVAVLQQFCSSLCCALAAQEYFTELGESLVSAAEVLLRMATALPIELPVALATGLNHAKIPDWSGARFHSHIGDRYKWPRQDEWHEQLQQIIREWQNERRRVML